MAIVVTGASGNLGALIIENLLTRAVPAEDLTATARDVEKISSFRDRGLKTVRFDYNDASSFENALSEGDTLVLIPGHEFGKRFDQHKNIIDAAKKQGVSRIIYTSAPQATTTALIVAPEHKATEEYLVDSGISHTILRTGWYTENYEAKYRAAVHTGLFESNMGDGRVASAPRNDYAEAAAVVVTENTHDGKVYELSGDTAWDGKDFAKDASIAASREVSFRPVSAGEHLTLLVQNGVDEQTAGFLVALDENTSDGLLSVTSGDLSRLISRKTVPLLETLQSF